MRCMRRYAIARAETERPSFIQVRSHIAYPAPNAVDTAKAHGAPLGEDEVRATKVVMGFDPELKFQVDAARVRAHGLARVGEAFQEEAERRATAWSRALPAKWSRSGSGPGRGVCAMAGRTLCRTSRRGSRLRRARPARRRCPRSAPYAPTMAGGAADLVESTKTTFEGAGEFSQCAHRAQHPLRDPRARDGGDRQRAGRPRRDGQALRLHVPGLLRLYARSVRLSALMELPVHVGVDARLGRPRRGRSHPPAGRALCGAARDPSPVGDAARRRERDRAGVEAGLEREDGPVALLLSRQNLPVLDRAEVASAEGVAGAATCCGIPRASQRWRELGTVRPPARRRRGSWVRGGGVACRISF